MPPVSVASYGRLCPLTASPDITDGDSDVPEPRLKQHFERTMKDEKVPLFKDFETYIQSLPKRMYAPTGFMRLFELPFWAKDESIERMARRLEAKSPTKRPVVKYVAAPSTTGKTASVLVGVLASAENYDESSLEDKDSFSHYLYLAFRNNGDKDFRFQEETLSDSEGTAERQGAAFALECLERLFNADPGPHRLKASKFPPTLKETEQALTMLLNKTIPKGRVLIHLDELRKMCDVDGMGRQSAAFRRGCMRSLAKPSRAAVITTYVDPLYDLPPHDESQDYCRFPVARPILCVEKIMKAFPALKWPTNISDFTRDEQQLWATLKLRLAAYIESERLLPDMHNSDRKFEAFLANFNAASSKAKSGEQNAVKKALIKCIRLCETAMWTDEGPDPNAVKLLRGVADKQRQPEDEFVRQISDVVAYETPSGGTFLTSSLRRLLSITDERYPIYAKGRDLLRKVLKSPQESDLLSSTPLEAMYAWVLSCRSAVDGDLTFTCFSKNQFLIKCERLKPGRFFIGSDTNDYNVDKLKENVIYYVDEPERDKHPLADMFFRTKFNEVVLISITGGNYSAAERTQKSLESFIIKAQQRADQQRRTENQSPPTPELTFYGIVLAPFADGPSTTEAAMEVIRGEDALDLLGGLRQVYDWL